MTLVCRWLSNAEYDDDIALAPPLRDDVKWDQADPGNYVAVLFVYGPSGNGPLSLNSYRALHTCSAGVNLA